MARKNTRGSKYTDSKGNTAYQRGSKKITGASAGPRPFNPNSVSQYTRPMPGRGPGQPLGPRTQQTVNKPGARGGMDDAMKREWHQFQMEAQKKRGDFGKIRTMDMKPSQYAGIDARDADDFTAFLKSKNINPNDQKYASNFNQGNNSSGPFTFGSNMAKTTDGSPDTPGQNQGGTYGGMFNFQQIMNDFYNYKPKEDDTAGQMQKQAFMGNLVQSMVDSGLAQQLGQFNAGLAQQNMSHQADLELRNQSATMADQFSYAMQNMEAQFQYQNTAANAQHDRDLSMLGATGQQQRDNIREQGNQDRIGEIVKGEQDRLKQQMVNESAEKMEAGRQSTDRYEADVAADASRDVANTEKDAVLGSAQIGADADIKVADTQKESALGVAGIGAEADKYQADAAKESSMYGADKTVEVAKVNAQGTIDNTKETGNQTRLTMGEETRQKAKDRANMHMYSKNQARTM